MVLKNRETPVKKHFCKSSFVLTAGTVETVFLAKELTPYRKYGLKLYFYKKSGKWHH
jgi:hypothetical protein